ncbi:MAG: hypothetical protein NT005_06680 [Spirochaetes bacterium]|nr:hypothetical protein [Spirochaetota bacterium]
MKIRPLASRWYWSGRPSRFKPLAMIVSRRAATRVPQMLPLPPERLVPPRIVAVIASSSKP